jgi:hypothetical protein
MRRFAPVFVILGLLALGPGPQAEMWFVHPDGTGDFPTIQAAVDGAADGDIIILTNGIFRGPGNRDVDLRGKAVTIRSTGWNPAICIIDCEGSPQEPHRAFVFQNREGRNTVIEYLGIMNGYAEEGGAMYLGDATAPTIRGCVLAGNAAVRGGALYAFRSNPLVEQTTITSNRAELGGGVYIREGVATGYYTRCILWGNCATEGSDVFLDDSAITYDCTVLLMEDIGGGGMWMPLDPIEEDPLLCDPLDCQEAPALGGDYHLRSDSPCLPENSPCGELVGALEAACEPQPTRVESWSWGRLKHRFLLPGR